MADEQNESLQRLGVEEDEGRVPDFDDEPAPRPISKSPRIRERELAEIMARYKRLRRLGWQIMDACHHIGDKMGIPGDTVYRITRRLAPTTDLAADILKANAAKMAVKVVKKGNVDQMLDVLTRSNIGVLAPEKHVSGPSGPQFFIGVSADSLGAVKVGVQVVNQDPAEVTPVVKSGPPQAPALPRPPARPEGISAPPNREKRPFTEGRTKATREAIARKVEKEERKVQNSEKKRIRERAKQLREEALKGKV